MSEYADGFQIHIRLQKPRSYSTNLLSSFSAVEAGYLTSTYCPAACVVPAKPKTQDNANAINLVRVLASEHALPMTDSLRVFMLHLQGKRSDKDF